MTQDDSNNIDFDAVDWSQLETSAHDENSGYAVGETPMKINTEMLAKRVMWDVVPCALARDVTLSLGMTPGSDEVESMEHLQSHRRLLEASPAQLLVQAMAGHASSAVVSAILVANGVELDEDSKQESVDRLEPLVIQTAFAIVAELLDIGFIHFAHSGVYLTSEEDEA